MRSLHVFCNGQSLETVSSLILIRDIVDGVPQTELNYGENPGRPGQRLLMRRRVSRKVNIVFAIRELRDLAKRADIVDWANAWAKDGVLKISNRRHQKLRVICAERAAIQKPRDYTEEFTISFEAPWPYWEEENPAKLTLTGASASGTLTCVGSAPSLARATITPTGGTLTSMTLELGESLITLNSLSIASGAALTIEYDERNLLRISSGENQLLSKRTEDSTDDLMAQPGLNHAAFTANTACTVNLEVCGSWL